MEMPASRTNDYQQSPRPVDCALRVPKDMEIVEDKISIDYVLYFHGSKMPSSLFNKILFSGIYLCLHSLHFLPRLVPLVLEDIQLTHETETRSSVLSIASDGIVARYEPAVHLLDNPLYLKHSNQVYRRSSIRSNQWRFSER